MEKREAIKNMKRKDWWDGQSWKVKKGDDRIEGETEDSLSGFDLFS